MNICFPGLLLKWHLPLLPMQEDDTLLKIDRILVFNGLLGLL